MKERFEFKDYRKWFKNKFSVAISDRVRNYYNSVADGMKRDFEVSKFWVELLGSLREYDQEYQVEKGNPLFAVSQPNPTLEVKSFQSFLEKTYRKNILENDVLPSEPENGWIHSKNWFSRINDIVRTLFVVRYFDGVGFLAGKIQDFCKEHKTVFDIDYEAREEGYYAAHIHIEQGFEIPSGTYDTKEISARIELQITTQVHQVIRDLLHKYYAKKRLMVKKPIEKWQWDYKCDEFCVNYLGHILHYVEGMIVEVREREMGESK